MPTVHLLDYVAGNIRSLVNAIEKCGWEVKWIRKPEDVEGADRIILPGVGHFGHCLTSLSTAGYLPAIQRHIDQGKPFFGICVGLQALFAGSEEAADVPGLSVIHERLVRFSSSNKDGSGKKAVPCIGWNGASTVDSTPPTSKSTSSTEDESARSFYGLRPTSKYYYVHSYAAPYTPSLLEKQGWTVATATYGDETYVGALGKGNVFATQFHPEKSGAAGLRVIKSWLEGKEWSSIHSHSGANRTSLANGITSPPEKSHNGLTHRIIACLDVRTNDAGDLVVTKGDQYDVREKPSSTSGGQVRNLGKPVALAERYYQQGADEVTFLNITSFRDSPITDLPMLEILRQTSRSVFVPLTIGGGIRDMVDPATGKQVSALEVAKLYFESGADKVSIGSDAVTTAEQFWANGGRGSGNSSIETISRAYGNQAVVVSVDPRRVFVDAPSSPASSSSAPTDTTTTANTTNTTTSSTSSSSSPSTKRQHTINPTSLPNPSTGQSHVVYLCTIRGGRETRDLDVVSLCTAVEALGAGEILLNAIDRDGTNSGYDLELIRLVKSVVGIPVIASSGAGVPAHFEEVFEKTRTDAALGAGMFHRSEYTVSQVKSHLATTGLLVRPFETEDTD